ncbi:hypothetical protein [Nocardia sp. X0981]
MYPIAPADTDRSPGVRTHYAGPRSMNVFGESLCSAKPGGARGIDRLLPQWR